MCDFFLCSFHYNHLEEFVLIKDTTVSANLKINTVSAH